MNDVDDECDADFIPRGVIGKRRGWEGEEMELDRDRKKERLRNRKGTSADDHVVAAVDIRQFQNHAIGEGYQAKHVIRQPSANHSASLQIKDMSGNADFGRTKAIVNINDSGDREYLKNGGLREFRKEIEIILSAP